MPYLKSPDKGAIFGCEPRHSSTFRSGVYRFGATPPTSEMVYTVHDPRDVAHQANHGSKVEGASFKSNTPRFEDPNRKITENKNYYQYNRASTEVTKIEATHAPFKSQTPRFANTASGPENVFTYTHPKTIAGSINEKSKTGTSASFKSTNPRMPTKRCTTEGVPLRVDQSPTDICKVVARNASQESATFKSKTGRLTTKESASPYITLLSGKEGAADTSRPSPSFKSNNPRFQPTKPAAPERDFKDSRDISTRQDQVQQAKAPFNCATVRFQAPPEPHPGAIYNVSYDEAAAPKPGGVSTFKSSIPRFSEPKMDDRRVLEIKWPTDIQTQVETTMRK
eukprot:NODE_2721_length_1111_cov_19.742886_g2597_i0.p1 GENE.NODE_2721_length_1111_cov_19.742886_g2597_i0~~NODE_2721_length_1111_cov_19.742886_g2597_i0.p1  ORF type:complete len:338 (-),score=70.33 NODE_2721_length_1111_cov_19.742886_g2597_i0:45-1058(-)